MENENNIVETSLADAVLIAEAMNGLPDWYEIPEELQTILEKSTLIKERMFWLRATHITQDAATTQLLRRAIYAEQRAWEMENRAAEMALITSGAAKRVKELEKKLDQLSKATS